MKKGAVLPFILFLASVAFILLSLFVLETKQETINRKLSQLNLPTPKASTSNWKTYSNNNLDFSLKYPENWYIINPGSDGVESINIKNYSEQELLKNEAKNMALSSDKINITLGLYEEKIQKNQSLEDYLKITGQWDSAMIGEPTSVKNIKVAGMPGLKLDNRFYVFRVEDKVFYSYFHPKDSKLFTTYDRILSTLKFTN